MLADIWGKLYLFHPRIVTSGVDWNRVLVEAIPKIEKAADADQLVRVLNDSIFSPLNDPFAGAQKRETIKLAPVRKVAARKLSADVGYLDARDPRGYGPDPLRDFEDVVFSLGAIKTLIVDLRLASPQSANFEWLRLFLASPQKTGGYVWRMHEGWNEYNERKIGVGVYHQRWGVDPGSELKPVSSLRPIQTTAVFIVNNASYFDFKTADILDVLQATSGASIIFERRGQFAQVSNLYADNIEVRLHPFMLLSKWGNLGPQPDYATTDPIPDGELAALAGKVLEQRQSHRLPPVRPFTFELSFPSPERGSTEPLSRERRLLGLFKIWTVISYMNPYLEYASLDWSTVCREWIPRVEAAESDVDYYKVLSLLIAPLNDSHVFIFRTDPPVNQHILPIQLRPVEGKPVVTETIGGASGEEYPIQAGDEILAIGGKRVDEIFAQWRPLISASSPGSMLRELVSALRGGRRLGIDWQEKDVVQVLLQNDTGKHTISLKTIPMPPARSAASSCKILENDFGYINAAMTKEEIERALDAIAGTKGLIVDLRPSYQLTNLWMLLPHLINKRVPSTGEVPVVDTPDRSYVITKKILQWADPHPTRLYTKPIVVLIDDRAQSSIEYFCTFLRDGHRATFVGSTTSGTNGNASYIDLPGGRKMQFTGMRAQFADGSRFENIGIVPDVKAEPTIRGVRERRDEVLEKGIETLKRLVSEGTTRR